MNPFISRILRIFRRSSLPTPCQEARTLASEYIDEELSPSLHQKIYAHISDCPLCKAFFDTLIATIQALSALPVQRAPQGFTDRIIKNIHEHHN